MKGVPVALLTELSLLFAKHYEVDNSCVRLGHIDYGDEDLSLDDNEHEIELTIFIVPKTQAERG